MRYHLAVIFLLVSSASAETIRFDLPQLAATYNYGHKINIPYLDLVPGFKVITEMQLEISGTQKLGWWEGDNIEGFSSHTSGGLLCAEMNTPDNSISPDNLVSKYSATEDGDFATIMNFKRTGGGTPNWSQSTNLSISNASMIGLGRFTNTPLYTLSNVTLIVSGVPVPEPSLLCLSIPFLCLLIAKAAKHCRL